MPDSLWDFFTVERFYSYRGERTPATGKQWDDGDWRVVDGYVRPGKTEERERELAAEAEERERERQDALRERDATLAAMAAQDDDIVF